MKTELLDKINSSGLGVIDEDRDYFIQVYHNFLRNPNYTPAEKLVFMELKSYAGTKNSCFPGQDGIAKDLGYTRKTVNTAIKGLREKGIVVVVSQKTSTNRKTVNTYILPKIDKNTGEFILSSLDKYRELESEIITVDGV